MDDYLAKPVRLQVLRSAVRHWVGISGRGAGRPR